MGRIVRGRYAYPEKYVHGEFIHPNFQPCTPTLSDIQRYRRTDWQTDEVSCQ